MAEINARVTSFMERFGATRAQASYLLAWVNRLQKDDVERSIASRIMQDDELEKIGRDYLERDPEYVPGVKGNEAYLDMLKQLTADFMDEVYVVMRTELSATTPIRAYDHKC